MTLNKLVSAERMCMLKAKILNCTTDVRLGFSVSLYKVTGYKQSAVCNEHVCDFINAIFSSLFSQWSADNVDHNVCTINAKGTLHRMGLIVPTTPGSSLPSFTPILRQKMRYADHVIAG